MKSARSAGLAFCVAVCLYGQEQAVKVQAGNPSAAGKAVGLQGTVEHIKVHGKSLEGNLEGDSPDRDVFIYLPPSYGKETNRRYPVVYFLHGYGIDAERYWNIMKVPEATDRNIAAG